MKNIDTSTEFLALGCDRLGSLLNPMRRAECIDLLEVAYQLGIRHFDTASVYGQGDSERYIGQAFKERRDKIRISTKAGQKLSTAQRMLSKLKGPIRVVAKARGAVHQRISQRRAAGLDLCFEPSFIASSLEASLARLQSDRVDIFYLHSPPEGVLADTALMSLLERFRGSGKIGAIGVSCDDLETALAAAQNPPVDVVQFGIDNEPRFERVMELVEKNEKEAIVRGLVRDAVGQGDSFEKRLETSFERLFEAPAVSGVIIGTTKAEHLQRNIEIFRRVGRG